MNVTVGTNARRRFFNRQALNTFCHIFLFLKRGFMVFVRLTYYVSPSSFYTTNLYKIFEILHQ